MEPAAAVIATAVAAGPKKFGQMVAAYFEPARLPYRYGHKVCNLHMRSYNVEQLEFFADFAVRAAYYLRLPATAPVPLPRSIKRWTVPRGPFVHKKSQENFERVTHKRVITLRDGDLAVVEHWLSYITKNALPGIGMKVYIWSDEKLE